MNYKLKPNYGGTFQEQAKMALEVATELNATVEFEFNGVMCFVDKDTDLERLWRDYMNSWTMEWKSVGPVCVKEYSSEIQAELVKRKALEEERRKIAEAEHQAKEDAEKTLFEERVRGLEIELSDPGAWVIAREKNSDPYGKAAIDYAEGWAKLMQRELSHGKTLADIAGPTSHELGFMGITGFMYGCAVNLLAHCWKYGEELRIWHNAKYGVGPEKSGTVNPAILTVKS